MQLGNEDKIVKIMVIGVGGAGNSVVNRIVTQVGDQERSSPIGTIQYVIANTDKQALVHSMVSSKILLGESTKGQGAGADPQRGEKAAIESEDDIRQIIKGNDLLFITAGMGGGTGTGASPVIAKIAKETDILVVAAVTTPFEHEGRLKMTRALEGIEKLKEHADALVIIDNQKLKMEAEKDKKLDFGAIMSLADEPLEHGIEGIASTVLEYGNEVNTDFADIRTIMTAKGIAHMGIGVSQAEENPGMEATQKAIESDITNTSIKGATGIVFNVKSSSRLSFDEYQEMSTLISQHCHPDAEIINGKTCDESMGDEVRVTIIATGIAPANKRERTISDTLQRNTAAGLEQREDYSRRRNRDIPSRREPGLLIPKRFR